jgi:hypothetical protein
MIKTLDQLMNAEVRSIEDINNAMKLENDDYPIDEVEFETPLELEKYKTEWKDYEKYCVK